MRNIQICQNEIAAGQKYQIKINGKVRYIVDSDPLELLDDYFIRKPNDPEVIFSVYEKARLLNAKYLIKDRKNKKELLFKTKSYFSNSYICIDELNNDKYEFFEHTKLRYTIYKNDYLMAFGRRDRFTTIQGDYYNINMSEKEDTLLVASMFLCIDDYRPNNGNLFNLNWGVFNEEIAYVEDRSI